MIFQYYHKAPKVVCSDYQCVAAIYAANREPDFFKHTINFVDAFHSRGHKKCSSAVHAQQFKNAHPAHATMNDSGLHVCVLYFCILFLTIMKVYIFILFLIS